MDIPLEERMIAAVLRWNADFYDDFVEANRDIIDTSAFIEPDSRNFCQPWTEAFIIERRITEDAAKSVQANPFLSIQQPEQVADFLKYAIEVGQPLDEAFVGYLGTLEVEPRMFVRPDRTNSSGELWPFDFHYLNSVFEGMPNYQRVREELDSLIQTYREYASKPDGEMWKKLKDGYASDVGIFAERMIPLYGAIGTSDFPIEFEETMHGDFKLTPGDLALRDALKKTPIDTIREIKTKYCEK